MTIAPQEVVQAPAREWRKYPEYKDSGVEWLGEVPADWDVKRLRHLCAMNPSKSETHELYSDTTVSFLPMDR